MIVFLDFEASSLGKHSYPIEVAWVFEDGRTTSYLIKPAAGWSDWDESAQAIHGIERETLLAEGTSHEVVAEQMLVALSGHALYASAPSWDGKWLSALLRAAGLPRHALRLQDSDDLLHETANEILAPHSLGAAIEREVANILALTEVRDDHVPAHRALPDAVAERERWLAVRAAAQASLASRIPHG